MRGYMRDDMKETVQVLHHLFKGQYESGKKCPAFKALVGLGHEAINDILDELKTPTFLYRVLPDIVGKDILTEEESIHQSNSCKAWILWGRKNRLIKYIKFFWEVFDEEEKIQWINRIESAPDIESVELLRDNLDFYIDNYYDRYDYEE